MTLLVWQWMAVAGLLLGLGFVIAWLMGGAAKLGGPEDRG